MTDIKSPPNPSGLCMCGCGQPTSIAAVNHATRGWVKGQPIRFIQGHSNRLRTKPAITRAFTFEETGNASGLCMCGCGKPTNISKETNSRRGRFNGLPNRYLPGHSWIKGSVTKRKVQKIYEVDADTGCWNWLLFKNKKGYGKWVSIGYKGHLAHRIMYEDLIGPIPGGSSTTIDHLCGNPSCVNPAHMEPVSFSENSKRKEGTSTFCPSLNFIVISAMNAFKQFTASLRSQTT